MTFPSCTTLELECDGDWRTVYEGREGIASFLEKGSRLAVLEAMKMHHELTASVAGTVTAVHVERGTQTGAGDVILIVEADA